MYCILLYHIVPSAAPTNFMASELSPISAFLSWTEINEEDRNGVIIQYVIDVTVQGSGAQLTWTSTSDFLEVIVLEPDTTYVCAVAAATSIGTGPFSSQITFQTPQDSKYYH